MAKGPPPPTKDGKQAYIGALPSPKTVTMQAVFDFNQDDIKSSLLPVSLCMMFGPDKTTPQTATWIAEWRIFCMPTIPATKNQDEEVIPKSSRALLFFNGAPSDKYKHALTVDKCKLSNPELKTRSIVMRVHPEETQPNTLLWTLQRSSSGSALGYFKVVQGRKYLLNVTFDAGSLIAEKVARELWRPIIYIFAKRQVKSGEEQVQSSRLFTNFATNWAVHHEPDLSVIELKDAQESAKRFELESENLSKQHALGSGKLRSLPHDDSMNITPATTSAQTGAVGLTTSASVASMTTSSGTAAMNTATGAVNLDTMAVTVVAYQSSLGPVSSNKPCSNNPATPDSGGKDVSKEQTTAEWDRFEAALKMNDLASIALPDLDLANFKCEISFDPTVERFVRPEESDLSMAIATLEAVARSAAASSTNTVVSEAAKHLLNTLSATSQLPGWQHVQAYMQNPQLYIERQKSAQRSGQIELMTRSPPEPGSVEDLQSKGTRLLKRLCQRVQWILDLMRRNNRALSPDIVMKIIAADRTWAEDANLFMKEAEGKVSEMLAGHPQKFNAFRELQKKGVQWPHTPQLRRAIEKAGFVFRPMMIKRDRCICEICGVEVWGWRSWHNPWAFHNFSKHSPAFQSLAFKAAAEASVGKPGNDSGIAHPISSSSSASSTSSSTAPVSFASAQFKSDGFGPKSNPSSQRNYEEKRKMLHARFNSMADIQSVLTLAPNPHLPWPNQTYYICRRNVNNKPTILISSFQLCDATNGKDNKTTGIEVMAECPETDIQTPEVEASWLFDLVHEISHQTAQRGPLIRQQLDQLGWVSFNIPDIKVPAQYLDPVTKDVAVILGVVSPTIPKFFILENESVRLVTVRLLTYNEWELIRNHGQAGRQLLAEKFAKDGTYHMSTIDVPMVSNDKSGTTASSKDSAPTSSSTSLSSSPAPGTPGTVTSKS